MEYFDRKNVRNRNRRKFWRLGGFIGSFPMEYCCRLDFVGIWSIYGAFRRISKQYVGMWLVGIVSYC